LLLLEVLNGDGVFKNKEFRKKSRDWAGVSERDFFLKMDLPHFIPVDNPL
jgi:hypothetical protein